MDMTRRLAVEFQDGTVRQFAFAKEAAEKVGVSPAAMSKALSEGREYVNGCRIRGMSYRMFLVRTQPGGPFIVCRITPFGLFKPYGKDDGDESNGIDPGNVVSVREIVETAPLKMSLSQRANIMKGR